MSIQSVVDAIEHCRAVIDEWPECASVWELGWREVDTRYAFIDPVLRGLGWNVNDPKECVPECRRGSGWLDYALFDRNGRSIILEGGAPTIAAEWRIYDVDRPGEFAEKLAAAVDITVRNVADAARELHRWLRQERWW